MADIIIMSPNRFSLYTICVTELLRLNNVAIKAIIVRRLLNLNRFLSEFDRDGGRLIKRIWKKLILRKNAYSPSNFETLPDMMTRERIRFTKVEDFKKNFQIPIKYCSTLNDTMVVDTLKKNRPDLVVFTGGGLIRNDVLENSGAGVLNCHIGVLSQYRGMDVVEWPILEDNVENIGLTVHFMDKGVDTGDILSVKKIKVYPHDTIKQLHERFDLIMCRQLVNGCLDYLNGNLKRVPQKIEDGKQYFTMHPRLMALAESKLENYRACFMPPTVLARK